MQVRKIVENLALEESMNIVDDDLFAGVDDLDKAEAEILDGRIEWYVVFYPALKIVNGICAIPTYILHTTNGIKV